MVAMDRGPLENVRILVENGACVNSFSSNQYSVIGYAGLATFAGRNPAVVGLLRGHGARDDPRDIDSAFDAAVRKGDIEQAVILLKQGADVNGLPWENVPLVEAAQRNDKEVIGFLLQHGADVFGRPGRGPGNSTRPLVIYVQTDAPDLAVIEDFLKGGEIFDQDMVKAALDWSERRQPPPPEFVVWLFRNADLTAYLRDKRNANQFVSYVASSGRKDLMEALLATGFDVNWGSSLDSGGGSHEESLIGDAALAGNPEVVQLLLEKGAAVNGPGDRRSSNEAPPVYLAALAEKRSVVKLLVEKGADASKKFDPRQDVGYIRRYGWREGGYYTLLLWALDKGFDDIALELMSTAVPLDAQGEQGQTALHIAAAKGSVDLVRALVNKGADIAAADASGKNALMTACASGNIEIVKILASKPVLNARSSEGATALMWASVNGKTEVVRELIARGADVNVVANNGQVTALTLAKSKGHPDIAAILVSAGARELPPPQMPKPIDYARTTKAQWMARFRELHYDPSFSPMTTPSEQHFKSVFGEPMRTEVVEFTAFWYYDCIDGTIQLKLVDPARTGSRLMFQGVNEY
jgi:ankyrin repeat protein